jgi:hypothetical protein
MSGGDGRCLLIGGGGVSHNAILKENYTFEVAGQNLNYGWYPYGGGMSGGNITGNFIVGGEIYFYGLSGTAVTGNTFSSGYYQPSSIPTTYPNNSYISGTPNKVVVLLNKYEAGRANVAIYNGSKATAVLVDLSSIYKVGDTYAIQDAQNFYGPPVATGTYNGGLVSIPMAARTVAQPVGGDSKNGARKSSFPDFAALVAKGGTVGTAVIDNPPIVTSYFLAQNYPNPFNPTTSIGFTLEKSALTTLVVYSIHGQKMVTIVNQVLSPGVHSYVVDASKWKSGTYVYTLRSGSFHKSKKMTLVK